MLVDSNQYLSSLKNFEQIIGRYDDLADSSIKNKLSAEGFSNHNEATQHLESLKKEGRSLKLGVIGRVNAGKSSLINALLFDGQEILPKAATPMTASLTSIGYAETYRAEVYFFSTDDVAQLQAKAKQFEIEVERKINSLKEDHKKRQEKHPNRPIPPLPESKLRSMAVREVSKNGALASASDICERMKNSGVNVSELGSSRELKADSLEELNKELMNYVGSSGSYMPFTRELVLGMPLPSLEGIEVIDTPGVNDPVKSREQRTYERLKECNAAFLVSPAGQFLSQQDFELADRLSSKEGTQEIYLVASQADMQLHSNIRDEVKGDLHAAMSKLQQVLLGQAQSAFSDIDNPVLKNLKSRLNERLIVTSGICETLLRDDGQVDEGASHALSLLQQNYGDYFAVEDARKTNLKLLSARDALQSSVDTVRSKKEEILQQQEQHFINAQWKTLQQVKDAVLAQLSAKRQEVESSDLHDLMTKKEHLRQSSAKAIVAVNGEFLNQAEEVQLKLPQDLERVMERAIEILDEKSESAEGTEQETYMAEKDGIVAGVARFFWNGGKEERTRSVETLKPLPIRRALEGLEKLIRNGMKDCASQSLLKWRQGLISGISRQLRETVSDDSVDINRLQSVCRSVVTKLIDFPDIEVPDLPAELAKSGMVKGNAVRDYLDAAQAHASQLEMFGRGFVNTARISIKEIMKKNMGEELLVDLMKEIEELQSQVENKNLTLEKMARMESDLKAI